MSYSIEPTQYGYRITFAGSIDEQEMKAWLCDAKETLKEQDEPFGVIVDFRELEPLSVEVRAILIRGQHHFKQKGMERSAVIVDVAPEQTQWERIATQSGIYPTERYVNAREAANPEAVALAWARDGIEPSNASNAE